MIRSYFSRNSEIGERLPKASVMKQITVVANKMMTAVTINSGIVKVVK